MTTFLLVRASTVLQGNALGYRFRPVFLVCGRNLLQIYRLEKSYLTNASHPLGNPFLLVHSSKFGNSEGWRLVRQAITQFGGTGNHHRHQATSAKHRGSASI
jgi:hypothetical protein